MDITLAWPNRVDTATLASSGASWETTLPLVNLQTRQYAQVARTTSATSFTLTALLPKIRKLSAVALVNHNLSVTGTVRFKAYLGTDNTSELLWDSGVLDAWPVNHDQSTLVFEDVDFWEGTISNDERDYYTKLVSYFAPVPDGGRFVEVIIADSGNPDGFIQIGRLFISSWWQPEIQPEYGDVSHNIVDPSEFQTVPETGTRYYRKLAKYRTVALNWKHLDETEAWAGLNDAKQFEGTTGEMLYAFTKTRTDSNYYATTFMCQFESLDPLTHPYVLHYAGSANLREIL